MSPRSTTP